MPKSFRTYFGNFVMLLDKILIVVQVAKYRTNNLAIWSHWLRSIKASKKTDYYFKSWLYDRHSWKLTYTTKHNFYKYDF